MSKPGVRIGSLFSGIGGWELGIEAAFKQANIPCHTVWQVEMDDYCRDVVLARHWPNARRYRDVKEVGAHNLEAADIICGGWPCQDLSYAGRGAGLEGERSGLFFEAVRIIREMDPSIIFLENVPALYTRGLDAVLWHLQSLRYDLRWGSLRASDMGAPHRRERWFCVGWKVGDVGVADTGSEAVRPEPRSVRQAPRGDEEEGLQWQRGGAASGSGGPAFMGNTDRQRLEVGQDLAENSPQEQSPAQRAGRDEESVADAQCIGQSQSWRAEGCSGAKAHEDRQACRFVQHSGRQTVARVDGDIDGLPDWLDIAQHRWPAPPGPRYDWEPPRTRARAKHDQARLKALGNSIVPQCTLAIAQWAVRELIEEEADV